MEDRTSAGLYLEMTNAPPDDYVAQRQATVKALPGVGIATFWRNQKPGRGDYPRTIPEFETLAVYEVDGTFDAPACEVLNGPLLDSSGGWTAGEDVQVCLEDLTTEDVMRTFDSLPADYKLSVCYLARIVRIDSPVNQRHLPVTTVAAGAAPTTEASP